MERVSKQALAVIVVIAFALALAVLLVPQFTQQPLTLPPALGDLRLQRHLFGDEARRIINQMHGKGVTPRDNAIGVYADEDGSATLYLSVYGEEEEAAQSLERMIRGIKTGFTPFSDYEQHIIEGQEVSFCTGDGQAHYFFAIGTSLYWLAVDFPIAEETLRALFRAIKPSSPLV